MCKEQEYDGKSLMAAPTKKLLSTEPAKLVGGRWPPRSWFCRLFSWLSWDGLFSARKPEGLPPGPYPLPLLGNILRLGKLPHRSLAELARRYGPLMSLRLWLVPFVVVSSPSLAKQVLLELDQAVSYRAPLDALKALDHDKLSVFSSPPGEEWRNLRKICNSQIFSNKRLDESQALRSLKVSDLVSFLEKSARAGEAVDVGRAAFTTTLNLLSTTILSEDLVTYEEFSSEFKDLVRQSLVEAGSPNLSDYFPLLRWLDLQGRRRRLSLLLRKTKDIFDRKIEDRQGERYSQSCSKPADFLQALLDAEASLELDRPTIIALLQVLCSLSPPPRRTFGVPSPRFVFDTGPIHCREWHELDDNRMGDDGAPAEHDKPGESPPRSRRSHGGFAKGKSRRVGHCPDALPAGRREGNPPAAPAGCSFTATSRGNHSSSNGRGNSIHHSGGHDNFGEYLDHQPGHLGLGLWRWPFPSWEVRQRRLRPRGVQGTAHWVDPLWRA